MLELPVRAGAWTRGEAERIEGDGLFSYMNGAGELYLAYRFDHLDVIEYTAPAEAPIVVEMYWMESSDDAFGLLSGDWGGEAVALDNSDPSNWPPRALYGAGLLRLWSGALFARVMAERETPASREAVLAFGRAIAHGHGATAAPALLEELPEEVGALRLRRDHVTFLRSYLVLNSVVFLASSDVLALGPEVEGVAARFDGAARPAWLILLRYPSAEDATRGEAAFRAGYLEDPTTAMVLLEDGWTALARRHQTLTIALACPDSEVARALVSRAQVRTQETEGRHE